MFVYMSIMLGKGSYMLGLFGATALVTAGMVGAGILILPAMMSVFGTWSIVGWILATLMTYSIATIFGRLSKTFKGGAGPIYYIAETFGPNYGFLTAWGYFFAMCFSGAGIATALGNYALPVLGCTCIQPQFIGFAFLMALFLLNIVSSGSANAMLIVMTVIKVLFFGAIAVIGFKYVGSYTPTFGPVTDILKSGSLAMFAFLGIEFASLSSGSIKDPEKNVMRATKLGLLFAAIAFIGVHCAVLFVLPNPELSARPVYDAVALLFGKGGALALGIVAMISCLSTLNGIIVVQSNTVKAVADNGWISKTLMKGTKQGFAWKGALIFCLASLLVMINPILEKDVVCIMANSLVGMVYLFSCLVDIKKSGWDFYNALALLSSVLILYNVNLFVFALISCIYIIGYLVKRLSTKTMKKGLL